MTNVFTIPDGRTSFYQWDMGQRLHVSDDVCCEVHFCNGTGDCSLVVAVYEENGQRFANVPNILLQTAGTLKVFAFVEGDHEAHTMHQQKFAVLPRTKPDDYVYTETEVLNYNTLDERIKALEENGGGGGGISPTISVQEIESGHRLTITDADGSKTFEVMDGKDGKDGKDGADGIDGYTPVKGVDYFDGENGTNGTNGKDGYTPQKGVDYYTEADKQEMVAAVMSSQPKLELIETITVDIENIGTIVRDGFMLDAVTLQVICPKTNTTGKVQPRFHYPTATGSNWATMTTITVTNSSTDNGTIIDWYKWFGWWRFKWATGVNVYSVSVTTEPRHMLVASEADVPYVNKITLITTSLPIGTTIKIYGVRRNEN